MIDTTTTTTATVAPISFEQALTSQATGTTAREMFALAYKWGNAKPIPETALKKVWPESPIANDVVTSYTNSIYFLQYCALKYWEHAANHKAAEEWRSKGMNEWGKILDLIDCGYNRDSADWLYLVARATVDGKANKESATKVIKPVKEGPYRRRVEMLAGMALAGFAFVSNRETLESVEQTRILKGKEKEAREAKKAEKAAKAIEKAAKEKAAADEKAAKDMAAVHEHASAKTDSFSQLKAASAFLEEGKKELEAARRSRQAVSKELAAAQAAAEMDLPALDLPAFEAPAPDAQTTQAPTAKRRGRQPKDATNKATTTKKAGSAA